MKRNDEIKLRRTSRETKLTHSAFTEVVVPYRANIILPSLCFHWNCELTNVGQVLVILTLLQTRRARKSLCVISVFPATCHCNYTSHRSFQTHINHLQNYLHPV